MVPLGADDGLALFDAACRLGDPLLLPIRLDIGALRALEADLAMLLAEEDVVELDRCLDETGEDWPAALATLPESERQTWQAFWQEVEGLLRGPVPAR